MRYAADLHLHSHYSAAVSKHMDLETIGQYARIKGLDVVGTGDCLQPQWLAGLEASLEEAEPGWFVLREEIKARIAARLSPNLRRPLRFVVGTEVNCAPPGSERLRGTHHLLFFPSFERARNFRRKIERYGDLAEGRPTLALTSRDLLKLAADHDCEMAPAHLMNPFFSSLGTRENQATLEAVFGSLTPRLFAVETGLTSTPAMCRRISTLDRHALFSNSDAHSPDNLGRECTILETEPGFAPMIAALRSGTRPQIVGTLKFPLSLTRYYLNRCSACAESFEGLQCPKCQSWLTMGSRDRLEQIADRAAPEFPPDAPPFRELLPLRYLIAREGRLSLKSKRVRPIYDRLIQRVGSERFILTRADIETLSADGTLQIARAIAEQRQAGHVFALSSRGEKSPSNVQPALL